MLHIRLGGKIPRRSLVVKMTNEDKPHKLPPGWKPLPRDRTDAGGGGRSTGPAVDCVLQPIDGGTGYCPICDPHGLQPLELDVRRNCSRKPVDTLRTARRLVEVEVLDDLGPCRTAADVRATLDRCFAPCVSLGADGLCTYGDPPRCERLQRHVERVADADCPHYKKRRRGRACPAAVPCGGAGHTDAGGGSRSQPRKEAPNVFVTMEKFLTDCDRLVDMLPPIVSDVVGIPRSGLIPAARIADAYHAALWSLDAAGEPVQLGAGYRYNSTPAGRRPADRAGVVVLVDDTVAGGAAMKKAAPIVRRAFGQAEIVTASVYAMPRSAGAVDLYAVELPAPHFLAWNFWNSAQAETAAVDFDGVLCEDIAPEDDDDGARYRLALSRAVPRSRMLRAPILLIATARLEKYRGLTEEWLARHGMEARRLVMGPWATAAERTGAGVIELKAKAYAESSATIYVESDPAQAAAIAERTGRRVLCPAAGRVFGM
jgi:hypoxanthine phosphoribosyltransferase